MHREPYTKGFLKIKSLKYIAYQLSCGAVTNLAENNPTQQANPPKIPYNPGTKSYLVAQMLIEGKKDDDTIIREVGVEKGTLWTVKSKLRRLGIIPPKSAKTPTNLTAQQKNVKTDESSSLTEDANLKTQLGQQLAANSPELVRQVAEQAAKLVTEAIRSEFAEILKGKNPENALHNGNPQSSTTQPASLQGTLPIEAEDVEVIGEKVNYKVALNPEIFWRYNVFKAEVERRGRKWNGSFSDFLDLATKDILAVYGIHPTVVAMKGKKLLVELPVNVEESAS